MFGLNSDESSTSDVPLSNASSSLLPPFYSGIGFTDNHVFEGQVPRAPGRVIGSHTLFIDTTQPT